MSRLLRVARAPLVRYLLALVMLIALVVVVDVHALRDALADADPYLIAASYAFVAVTVGTDTQTIPRNTQLPMPRTDLQEDGGGDADEIRVRIRIHAVGMPPTFTPDVFTDQEVLLG